MSAVSRSLVLLGLLWAGCAHGGPKKQETTPSEAEVAEHNEGAESGRKIVCRRERIPGSHQSKRVCRLQSQQRRQRDQAGDMMRRSRPVAPVGEGGFY